MGFNSMRNRKPFEMASMINHSQIIQNRSVQNFIDSCIIPKTNLNNINYPSGISADISKMKNIKYIISVDGGYSETYIDKGFPSTALAFFNFGVLLFKLEDLENIDQSTIINPEDLKKLKEMDNISLVIPAKNILVKGCEDFTAGVRKTIFNFFNSSEGSSIKSETLLDTLKWLIYRKWDNKTEPVKLDFCPYDDCDSKETIFNYDDNGTVICQKCHREIYLTDYFRFHEIINEPNGSTGIYGYLSSLIEQMLIVQVIKYLYENNRQSLKEVLFIKDGPLAFFGQTFRLYKPMRDLINHLFTAGENKESIINLVGIEKSGPFVEHAFYIQNKLEKNHFYIINDDYIRKYIVIQTSNDIYGHNTYYGWKVIYKTEEGDVLVVTIPVNDYNGTPSKDNFSNIEETLSVLSKMRCNMYENSVIPLALINKLVSISEFPSTKILEKFIKNEIKK